MNKNTAMLDAVVADIRSLANKLQALAAAMSENSPVEKPQISKSKKIAAKETPAESAPKEEKTLMLEDVRAVLADKSRQGHTAEVKDLLIKHGADRLSAVDPSEYASLIADAEAL